MERRLRKIKWCNPQELKKMETTTVIELLGLSSRAYKVVQDMCYLDWCKTLAFKMECSPMAYVKSPSLRNWYNSQWITVVEKSFLLWVEDFKKAGVTDTHAYAENFKFFMHEIKDKYPKTIIEKI